MSSEIIKYEKNILNSISSDIFKQTLSFLQDSDIYSFANASKGSYELVKSMCLDTVHYVAWIADDAFHVRPISSSEKHAMNKDVWTMTANAANDEEMKDNPKLYLLENFVNNSFDWAMFIRKQHHGVDLNETKGYWKMLAKDYSMIKDLNILKSLVLHKEIVPMLLDYSVDEGENPFKNKITVNINDKDSEQISKYDILFWNGASPNQCNTFEIHDHQKDRTRYLMNFNSFPSRISWHWYDNDSSRFKPYNLGQTVNAQIECSFLANLTWNFPLELQDSGLFNNSNLTEVKKAFSLSRNDKVFVLRCGIDKSDEPKRIIDTVEQLTVTTYGFPRSIKRIKEVNGKYENDFCHHKEDNFDLRMAKYNPWLKIQTRKRSNSICEE